MTSGEDTSRRPSRKTVHHIRGGRAAKTPTPVDAAEPQGSLLRSKYGILLEFEIERLSRMFNGLATNRGYAASKGDS